MLCFLIKEVECSSVLSYWELSIRKDLCLNFGIGTMIKIGGPLLDYFLVPLRSAGVAFVD